MIRESRNLVLEVTDYSDKVLCSLYDNSVDSSGQAFDVFVASERNGWKELSFEIPSTMNTPDGVERNFRLDFLKPNYKIRLIDDFGEDFFLISQSAQKHNGKNTNMSVKVGHISQLLKTKRLDLEFSDKEGNNVGTAAELLATILEGTGWTPGYVEQFLEKDGVTVKKRSLKASAKSGAFKLISSMCTLFDAKPIYHGKEKTVDIIPINPFAKPNNGELPDVTKADGVVELAYSHNVTNVTRSENGENIATKLYAYGSYGDTTDGYCGIDECTHKEHVYTLQSSLAANTKYYFSYVDDNGTTVYRNFTTDRAIPSGSRVIYSMLDPASQMYAWIETDGDTFGNDDQLILNDLTSAEQTYIRNATNVNGYAYCVGVGNAGTELPTSSVKTELVQNWFSFLMDFTYFQTVGLLENEGLQYIAEYQRFANPLYELSYMKQQQFAATQMDLAETIGDVDFCKLNVSSITNNGGYACINLNKTTTYPDGIIYRSDYEINTKEHFIWTPSPELKSNGDPKTTGASMLLVVYNTTPATWTKAYLRAMDDKDNPSKLTFHIDYSKMPSYSSSNKYYLFGSNNINGYLGGLEIGDESNTTAINNKTKTVTVNHYVRFSPNRPTIISITDPGAGTHMDYDLDWYKIDNYGWWYKCDDDYNTESELYFCYYDHFTPTETTWSRVRFQKAQPSAPSGGATEYWYNWGTAVLYRYMSGSWTALDSPDEKKVAAMFSPVYKACRTHDLYRKGMYEYYTYTAPGTLNAGNYFLSGPYDGYHVFTTTESLSSGDKIIYEAPAHEMYIAKNGSLDPIQADLTMEPGWINNVGAEVNDTTKCRSANFISVTAGQGYSLTGLSDAYRLTLYKYNSSKGFVSKIDNLSGYDGTFQIETGVSYIKFSTEVFAEIFNQYTSFKILNGIKKTIEFKDYRFDNVQYPEGAQPDVDTTIIIEKQNYTKLTPTVASGRIYGIAALVKDFADYSDEAYITDYAAAKTAQSILDHMSEAFSNKLGPMYLEGYWQKKDYVDGDEDKLYEDALDTIKEISHPKATYQITYLDQYGLEENDDNGVSPLTTVTRWPDLTTQSAAHLIDPELGINCWAYIDKINKCYDVPEKTTIAVNTDLSTISQHSFADVMANIADVANSVKAKEELIDRAGAITGRGRFDANRLQGAIDAAKLAIFGGSSTWYTDDNGNMVFESADGRAAMTLTGSGFAIANTKDEWGDWNWRTLGTGDGLVADEITTGHLSSNLIEAGSISVDKVEIGFGKELDISENTDVVTANTNASDAVETANGAVNTFNDFYDNTYTPFVESVSTAVESVDVEYYLSTSTSEPTGGSWSTTAPAWENGKYMWSRTKITDIEGHVTYEPSTNGTCIAGAKGQDGQDGSDGLNAAVVTLYQRSDSTPAKPSGDITYNFSTGAVSGATLGNWTINVPASNGNPCYVIQASASSQSTTDVIASTEWSSPVVFVEDGTPGASGDDGYNTATVYLYKRSASAASVDWSSDLTYTFSTGSLSSLPSGWSESVPSGTDPIYVTCAVAHSKNATDTIPYTEFVTPVILAQNGADGQDGQDGHDGQDGANGYNSAAVFLYQRSASLPAKPSNAVVYTFADGSITGTISPWSQTIPTSDGNPCYVIQAAALSQSATDTIEASDWSEQIVLVEDGVDGTPGDNGYNTATVYLYKRSASAATVDWLNDLTYTFSTGSLSSVPSGWSESVPSGTDPVYVTCAVAHSKTATDTIPYTEFVSPVILAQNGEDGQDGQDGQDGVNGYNSAAVFLYQRASSVPAKPSGSVTYTFADGSITGTISPWSQTIPASNGNPCYVIQAAALSQSATDTIAASDWSNQVVLVEDGIDGSPGDDGYNSAVVFLYKRSSTAISQIDWNYSIVYTFSNNSINTTPTGWSRTVPSGSDPIYVTTASAYSRESTYTITTSAWSTPTILAENGDDGVGISSITEQYYLSTSSSTQTGGSWKTTPDPWENGKYYWTRSHIVWTDGTETDTTPVLANGLNSANQTAYSRPQMFVQETRPTTGYKVGDLWQDTANDNRTYLAVRATGTPSTDWVLTSAGLLSGAKLEVDPEDGTIDITASETVTVGSAGVLQLAGSHVSITSNGILDVLGGSDINVTGADINVGSNGNINVASGGKIDIASDGKINLTSADGITLAAGNTLLNEATSIVTGHNMLGNGDESATNSNSVVKEWFYFEEMTSGQDYTFTVCIKPAQDTAVTHYRLFSSSNDGSVVWIYPDGTDKQIISASFTFSGYANANHMMRLYLPNNVTTTANTTIYWAVLEKGRKSPNGNPSSKNICEWSPCRNGSYNLLYGADDVKPMPALSTDTKFGDWKSDDMVAGEIYTFTACVQPGSGWEYFDLRTCADQSTTLKLATIQFLGGTQKQVVSGTFTFPGYIAGSTNHQIYGRTKPDGTSTSGTVYWVKLCKGTEREAWSSNINEINNSKVTIDNTGINLLTDGVMNLAAGSGMNISSGSNLNIEAGGKLKVSANDIIVSTSTNQTLTEQISSSIQLSVSQLTTGGTNMILDGDKQFSGTSYNLAEWPYFQEMTPGEMYTFTVCMTPASQTDVPNYRLFTSAGTGSVGRLYPSGTDKQILSLTFQFMAAGYTGTNHVLRLYRGENVTTTASTTIHWAKLEKAATGAKIGSKIVTDVPYSPPPNGSDNMLYNSNVEMVASDSSTRYFGNWQSDDMITGETYTFTACIKPGSDHGSFTLNVPGTQLGNRVAYNTGTGKQVVSVTFVFTGYTRSDHYVFGYRAPASVTTAGTLYWAKLCKGTNREAWSPNPNEINGSTIKVTQDSINIATGGTLNMSGGTVNIESGGTLNISAGTKGTIDLQDGVISSKKGVFDTIEVKSGSTTMNIQPSTSNQAFLMPIKCYFTINQSTKPSATDHQYLWFNSSSTTTLSSTVNVPYSGAPSVSPDGRSFTSEAVSNVLTNNTVNYKLTVTLNRNAGSSSTNTIPIGVTARVYNTNSGSSNYVDLTASAQSMAKWDAHTFELTGSSSTAAKNLFASKNTLAITLKTVNDVNEPCYVYGQMTLTGTSAGSASEGTVTVTYVP